MTGQDWAVIKWKEYVVHDACDKKQGPYRVKKAHPRHVLHSLRSAVKRLFAVDGKAVSSERELLKSESQMTRNRMVLGGLGTIYFWLLSGETRVFLLTAFAYIAYTIVLALDIKLRRMSSARRRFLALVGDITILSLAMHEQSQTYSVFFGAYLWVIFGNGFRFGLVPLFQAIAIATLGFAVVVATTAFWSSHLFLSIGLILVLLIPTSYCSTLIWSLLNARLEAEEANNAKSLFLAALSHELRTPLNAIIGSVGLVETSRLHSDDAESFAAIEVGAATLLSLIGNILDLSRIEAGRMPSVIEEFGIAALLSEVRELAYVEGRRKGLSVSVFISEGVTPVIQADRRHLSEVLLNLASNAVKFTDRGWVLIGVFQENAPLGISRLRFEVKDTGIGISEAAQNRIFSSFTQEDRSVLDRFGGTGLGLAICKGLAKLMGGEIGVTSQKGVGSTFWFTIEYHKALSMEPQQEEVNGSIFGVSKRGASKRRIRELSALSGFPYEDSNDLLAAFTKVRTRSEDGLRDVVMVDGASMDEAGFTALALLDPYDRVPRILIGPTSEQEAEPEQIRLCFDTILPFNANSHGFRQAMLVLSRSPVSSPRRTLSYSTREQPDMGGNSAHILIADDNETNRRVLVKTLERVGYRTTAVGNGMRALEAMRKTSYDLVLMDINMPVMNGLEATRAYRETEPSEQHLQIFAVTADATEEAERASLSAGMDGCFTKPVVPVKLLQRIAAITRTLNERTQVNDPDLSSVNIVVEDVSLDRDTLAHICSLGSSDFMAEVLTTFNSDVNAIIHTVSEAAARSDRKRFSDGLHKLLGAAVNVGARMLTNLARIGSRIATEDLPTKGVDLVLKIEHEHAKFVSASNAYVQEYQSRRDVG